MLVLHHTLSPEYPINVLIQIVITLRVELSGYSPAVNHKFTWVTEEMALT